MGFPLDHPCLRDTEALFGGLEEFRQHLGGRLTITMLRGVGDPVDVHEIDDDRMREAIRRVSDYPSGSGATIERPADWAPDEARGCETWHGAR